MSSSEPRRIRLAATIGIAVVAVLITGCLGGGDADGDGSTSTGASSDGAHPGTCLDQQPDTNANLLQNASFEEGAEPWVSLTEDSGYQVTVEQAHSGEHSALLRMRDPAEAFDNKVYYLVQEITPSQIPDVVCGYYRVENWMRGSRHQYLQVVAIAFEPTNFPPDVSNYQIRYLLAGADSPPFPISNAKFVFVTRDQQPVQGEWVPFELHLKDDFQEQWGAVPEGFSSLRLLFEVRWDNKVSGEGAAEADAFYDDLYAGTE
jgi:hypothetical protein